MKAQTKLGNDSESMANSYCQAGHLLRPFIKARPLKCLVCGRPSWPRAPTMAAQSCTACQHNACTKLRVHPWSWCGSGPKLHA